MEFSILPQSDRTAFYRLDQNAAHIDEKCLKILGKIKETFERDSVIGSNVCSIDITTGIHEVALIKSPVGNGRVVRRWSRSSGELQGMLIFQREQFDDYDQRHWETVWGITVPRYDDAYSGIGGNSLRFELDGFSVSLANVSFSAAMSILAGLVDGPQSPPPL